MPEQKVRPRVQKHFTKPSRTKQEFKEQCDLALTIKRFQKTPEGRETLKQLQNHVGGQYLDVSNIPDYRTVRDAINRADASFMALPAIVRKRFGNDAAMFVDFCSDPANLPELRKMGLAKPEVEKPVKPADAGSSTPPVKG